MSGIDPISMSSYGAVFKGVYNPKYEPVIPTYPHPAIPSFRERESD